MITQPRLGTLPFAGVRLGARAGLAAVVALSAIVRSLCSLGHLAPSYFPDEYIYTSISRSLAASGRPLVRGEPAHFPALLEPLLAAPLWAAAPVETAYRLVQVENALLMSLAAIPVYALARRLELGTRYSLACAAFAVAIPDLVLSSRMLADPVGYPLALAALYAGVVTLQRSARLPGLAFVLLAGLATTARVQYVVLAPAFVIAALLLDRRRAFRTQAVPLGLFAAAAVAVAIAGAGRVAGYYSSAGLNPMHSGFLRWLWLELFLLALAGGVALAPGAIAGFVTAKGRRERAFTALAGPFALAILAEAAVYSSHSADEFKERYLVALLPLVPLAFGLWLRRGRPARIVVAIAAGAIVIGAAVVPLSGYAAGTGYEDAPFLWSVKALEWRLGIADASLLFAALATAGALIAVGVAWRRVPSAVAVAWALGACAALSVGATIYDRESSKPVRSLAVAVAPSWIDAARLGPVSALETPGADPRRLIEQLFWNDSLRHELLLGPGATATDAFAAPTLRVAPDGTLLLQGHPLMTSLLVDGFQTTVVIGGVAPAGRFASFSLWRLTGTPRLEVLEPGRFWDGWLGVRGELRAWPTHPGAVSFTLSLPRATHEPVILRFGTRSYRVRPGARLHVSLPIPTAGPWRTTFRVVGGARALIDQRPVSVRSTVPALVWHR